MASMPDLSALHWCALLAAIAAVACLYSSVGHGGATGYLAAAALLGLPAGVARPGALWMNCFVAGIAFWRFRRRGYFDARVFLPLAAASVPCAWLGSRLHLDGWMYAWVLGGALFAAGWALGRGSPASVEVPGRPVSASVALPLGAGLGLLAGLTGIGGGVFLTPVLILARWASAKTAGGISALFIVFNSISGLAGLGEGAIIREPAFAAVILLGIAGALVGTHLGVNRWRPTGFRRALAVVLWIAAGKLVLTRK